MLHFSYSKIIAILGACGLAIAFTLPNFFPAETVKSWPRWLPHQQMPLGLDLRGGAHLLLAMDIDSLRRDGLDTLKEDARRRLRSARILFTRPGIVGDEVQVRLRNASDLDRALEQLRQLNEPTGNVLLGTATDSIEVSGEGNLITLKPTEAGINARISSAVSAALETIRRRIDGFGTSEPLIVRQGLDRILVQVPGLDDTETLRKLIGKTAKLTFHEVHPSMTASEARQTRVPIGYKIYPPDPESDRGAGDYLLRETPVVQGDDLVDAQQGFDAQTSEPVVNFRFNQKGARIFARFTTNNVGRPFAIVLDGKVLSAPVIRSQILGGSGQISGSFSVKSANQLAIQLRSGALPASLTVVEERTVGPSLGADSVAAGQIAGVIGGIAVTAFMVFAYGLFGIFAVVAVFINMCIIVAIMSLLGSTLTLPGIAGLILTIGMAVDANVLIYERIREELRNGKTPISAIDAGFSRAFGTILDSNLTTLIAAIVMFWLGSGPVRGFAVTLSIGIFATVFTAFTVTRLQVALWLQRQNTRKVPIPV